MTQDKVEKYIRLLNKRVCCALSQEDVTEGTLSGIKATYKKLLNSVTAGMPRRVAILDELSKIAKLIKRLKCKVCSVVDLGVTMMLVNEEGDQDLSYPLGVLSVNNSYIGIANNEEEYITLWNSNVDNQLVGQIISGTGTTFKVEPVDPEGLPFNLYGLEFYSMTSSSANVVVHVSDNDIIAYNAVAVRGSTGASTLSSSLNEYNGVWGVELNTPIQIRTVTCTGATAGTTIRIFHSRVSERVGANVVTPYTSMTGLLPKACKTYVVRGGDTVDFKSGITNWNELQSIEYYAIVQLGGGIYRISNVNLYNQPPASTLYLRLNDLYTSAISNVADFGWVTAAHLPNLQSFLTGTNDNNIDLVGGSVAWFLTMPKVTKRLILSMNVGKLSDAANSDTAWNNVATALAGITPTAPATLRLDDTTARTAASLTSRDSLIAAGWNLTFT